MKRIIALAVASVVAVAASAAEPVDPAKATYADIEATFGSVPTFLKVFPSVAISGAWNEMKSLQMNPHTALSGKEKELIGLAVAAQIPCHYCIYFHTESAKANGATDEEVREAIAMSALTRHWSTFLNGAQIDMEQFKQEYAAMMKFANEQEEKAKAKSPKKK
jgi:AhpD family alkylhydroperoxidase